MIGLKDIFSLSPLFDKAEDFVISLVFDIHELIDKLSEVVEIGMGK
jgi:hypothetical protein